MNDANRAINPKTGKTPAILPELQEPSYQTWWAVRVVFDTDLFVDKDEESTKAIVNDLKARLANADGAREPIVTQRVLYIKFDRRHTPKERMEAHLKAVVAEIMEQRQEKGYFPFTEPTFTYEIGSTPSVIL